MVNRFFQRLLYQAFLVLVALISFWFNDSSYAQEAPSQPLSYVFTGKNATAVVNESLAKEGISSSVRTSIYNIHDDQTIVSAPQPIEAELDGLEVDKAHNHWLATLILKAGDKNLAPVKISGHYDELTQLPVLKRNLQSGDIISSEDIGWSEEPASHLHKSTITDPKDLIGKSPRRMISQDRPIRLDEVTSPAILNKGAQVTLIFKSPNLEIKTLGEAMEGGAKGDVIRVRNVASKTIIQGTIVSSGDVRVTSPDTASAEAM